MTFSVKYSRLLLAVVSVLVSIMDMSAQDGSAVNTPATAYTVEELLSKGVTGEEAYVEGRVSRVLSTNVAADGWITYYISSDGNKKSQQLRLVCNYKGETKKNGQIYQRSVLKIKS